MRRYTTEKNRDEFTLHLKTGLVWFALRFVIAGWAGGPWCEHAYFFVRDHPHNRLDTEQPPRYCSTDFRYLHECNTRNSHSTLQY